MSTTYKTILRVFGTTESVLAASRLVLGSEQVCPSQAFKAVYLDISCPDGFGGFEFFARRQRSAPELCKLDLVVERPLALGDLVVEHLLAADDQETHRILQAGRLLYEASRQEMYGNEYRLGDPDVPYVYVREVGSKTAFADALRKAGVRRPPPPL